MAYRQPVYTNGASGLEEREALHVRDVEKMTAVTDESGLEEYEIAPHDDVNHEDAQCNKSTALSMELEFRGSNIRATYNSGEFSPLWVVMTLAFVHSKCTCVVIILCIQ